MPSLQWTNLALKTVIGTHENPMDNSVHPTQLWDGRGHWDLEVYLKIGRENPMDSPVHPTGLKDGTGRWVLGVYLRMGTYENPMGSPVHPMGL